jgi:hypothetical protein
MKAKALKLVPPKAQAGPPTAAEIAVEIHQVREEGAAASASRDELRGKRQQAATYEEAEALAGRIARLDWEIEHSAARLDFLEVALAQTRGEEQRTALARHHWAFAALYPRLRRAISAAAEIQGDAIRAREAAVVELGEGLVAIHLPHLVYNGFLLHDLVKIWTAEQDKIWAVPWQPPALVPAVRPAARSKPSRSGDETRPHRAATEIARPGTGPVLYPDTFPRTMETPEAARRREIAARRPAPPAPAAPTRPRRVPRKDAAPAADSDQVLVRICRSGVTLADGFHCAAGDLVALAAEDAKGLILSGAVTTEQARGD